MNSQIIKAIAIGHFLAYYYSDLNFINQFHKYLQNQANDQSYYKKGGNFYTFLETFGVLRWVDKHESSNKLKNILDATLEHISSIATVKNVDFLADILKENEYTKGRQVSLASKILFLNNPTCITPVDQNVKRALGIPNGDRCYANYLSKFCNNNCTSLINKTLEEIADFIKPIESHFIEEECFIKVDNIEFIRRNRLKDKILWVIGSKDTK